MNQSLLRRLEPGQLAELDAAERSDVGDGEAVTGHPRLVREPGVQYACGVEQLRALRSAEVRELRILQRGQARMRVPHAVGNHRHEVQFDLPIGHLDERPFFRGPAHQVRLGIEALEIGADGARLGQEAPIVQFQHRYPGHGIPCGEGRAPVVAGVQVQQHPLDALDALLGDEHVDATGVRCAGRSMEFHGREYTLIGMPSTLCCRARDR